MFDICISCIQPIDSLLMLLLSFAEFLYPELNYGYINKQMFDEHKCGLMFSFFLNK